MKNLKIYSGLKKKGAALIIIAMLGGVTGCSSKDVKKDVEVIVEPQVVYAQEVVPTVEPTPIPTPVPTPIATPIATVAPQTSNLRACSEYKIVNTKNVNMRLDANKDSLKLGQLNRGDRCRCIAEYKDWSLVLFGKTICFVKSEYLNSDYSYESSYDISDDLDIVYATTGVYFRLFPEVNDNNKIMLIPENSEIEVFGVTDHGWYLAKYDGKIGYVYAKYTESLKKKIQQKHPEVKNLKVRKIVSLKRDSYLLQSPDSSSGKIMDLEIYQSAEVLGEENGYYLVKVDKRVGYLHKKDAKELGNICIIIDLSEQELKVYVNDDVVLTTLVSTGKSSTPTPIGLYEIEDKVPGRTLEGPDYSVWVNYWMKVYGGVGIHDIKGRKMGTPRSHGCISCEEKPVAKIYEICPVGTDVNIQR